MKQYSQEIEIMKKEMTNFDDTMREYKKSQDETGRAAFETYFKNYFLDMSQYVPILYFNFKGSIRQLMQEKTLRTRSATKTVRMVEGMNKNNVKFQFDTLKSQTTTITYYLSLHTIHGPIPLGDHTTFTASMEKLNNIIQSLEDQLLPVSYEGRSKFKIWDFAPDSDED